MTLPTLRPPQPFSVAPLAAAPGASLPVVPTIGRARVVRWVALAVASAALAACGGGGETDPSASSAEPLSAQAKPGVGPADAGQPATENASGSVTQAPALAKIAAPAMVQAQLSTTDAVIPNPERGFYVWAADHLMRWDKATAAQQYADGHRLVYAPVRLDAYRAKPLPDNWLINLEKRLDIARQNGLKLILRFAYNYPADEKQYRNAKDANLPQVLAHIEQLTPVLQRNADVIAYLQAGFVGAWGEWHTSSNRLTEEPARSAIPQALLRAVPSTHAVQFRYPPYIRGWSPTPPGAMDGSDNARTAFHNDCFLSSTTDVGTYSESPAQRAVERAHMAALGAVAPFGGETCNPADEARAQPRTNCDDILAEGQQFGLVFLNGEYYKPLFHNRWKAQGCFDTVARRLGYRLSFGSVNHPSGARRGQTLAVQAQVSNEGWSRVFLPRRLELVLVDSAGREFRLPITGADPRTWTPQRTHAVNGQATVPNTLPTGRYDVLLALPDGAARLANQPRFAIRPANADNTALGQRWEAARGAFRLGTQLTVSP